MYFPNDSKFLGQFVDGMIKGYGEYFEKGKLKCKGMWKDGKLMLEKKEEDGSYNYEEEIIDWGKAEEVFEKNGTGITIYLEMLTMNKPSKLEEDQKFKLML